MIQWYLHWKSIQNHSNLNNTINNKYPQTFIINISSLILGEYFIKVMLNSYVVNLLITMETSKVT